MIDIEFDVFDAVADELRLQYPGIWVSGLAADLPSRYPAVTLVQRDSSIALEYSSVQSPEMATSVMFQADVYSNQIGGAKVEAKRILATVDDVMTRLGFARLSAAPVDNLQDGSIYRLTARWEALVDKDLWIYRQR